MIKLSNLTTSSIFTAFIISLLLFISSPVSADISNNCSVQAVNLTNGQGYFKSFSVSNNTATATFVVTGDPGCSETVSIAVWQAPYGSSDYQPYSQQKFISSNSADFTPGTYTISIPLPNCDYQVDLIRGSSVTGPDITANYVYPQLIDWLQAGSTICEPPVVVSSTETVPPTTPATPTPQPTTLINTGAGDVIGLFAITVISAAMLHRIYIRRRFN